LQIKTSGITDVGLQREGNEDSFCVEDSIGLYVVADGMGGHLAGEVASKVAVEIINKSCSRWIASSAPPDELFGYSDQSLSREGNYILSSIRLANRIIYEMGQGYEQYRGMGTTISAVLVTPSLIVAANVGDSRIYIVRDDRIERLSKDHTIVSEQVDMGVMTAEEAAMSPLRHILTRNLGSVENVDADVFELEPFDNDRIILCSDGLTDLVSDEEILEITQKEDDPDTLCKKFVEKARSRGAHDNTTVVSVYLCDVKKRRNGLLRKVGVGIADFLSVFRRATRKYTP